MSLRERKVLFQDDFPNFGSGRNHPRIPIARNEQFNSLPVQKLIWNRSDTDLLELVTALYESNAVKTDSGKFTKKELQSALEWMFNHPVKGAGAKLTKARDRKLEPSVFMEELKQAFSRYVLRKDDEVNKRNK